MSLSLEKIRELHRRIKQAEEAKLKQTWYDENAPLGKALGYPECCIRWFGNKPPELLNGNPSEEDKMCVKASFIDGNYTGFIPCPEHARKILNGETTLASLIENRNPEFPEFPNAFPID